MNGSEKKIKILPNGPYEVFGGIPLYKEVIIPDGEGISTEWKKGKDCACQKGGYTLCRCGHSKDKPFCDDTHEEIDFDGSETADNIPYVESAEFIKGKVVDLLDKETLCAYARFCDRGDRIWNIVERADDKGSVDLAVEEAACCSAGRLTIVTKEGDLIEPKLEKEITLTGDTVQNCKGPLWVKGGISVEGADGTKYETRNRVTLCRCGESRNKPFCDGTHVECPHMQELDD